MLFVFNIDSWTVAHKRTKSLHTPSVTRIVGWMDHISDGSKWPSEQRELQREQLLAEWQAVAARQEKNQKNCVDLQEALRVQQVHAVLLDLLLQCHRSLPLGRLQLPLFGRPLAAVRDMVHPADYQRTDGVWSDLVRLCATVKLSMSKTRVGF